MTDSTDIKEKKTKVKLLKPHTHEGRDYPVGAKIELSPDSAKWLVSLETAQEIK